MIVGPLDPIGVDEVVDVLCDAFGDYPVMRFVLGADDPSYDRRLPVLIGLFVRGRVARRDPVYGARDPSGRLLGVATLTAPGDAAPAPSFIAEREAVWEALGAAERARYESFVAASDRTIVPAPHYYLNMLGVRRAHAGRGVGGRLLAAVHARSLADPASAGVALSTENPANVPLYEHAGYRILARKPVAPGLETWALWRADEGVSSDPRRTVGPAGRIEP